MTLFQFYSPENVVCSERHSPITTACKTSRSVTTSQVRFLLWRAATTLPYGQIVGPTERSIASQLAACRAEVRRWLIFGFSA